MIVHERICPEVLIANGLLRVACSMLDEERAIPSIRKIYFNDKHTTIEWEDGVKTTVGCMEGQEFDEYSGFTAAIAKRLFGSSNAAIRFMNEHKEVQPEPIKKAKKATTETAVTQDA